VSHWYSAYKCCFESYGWTIFKNFLLCI
jgi:hypothetical protein